ncbi:hypothetical protein MrNuV_ORF028 [Macrobrachium rosenbergii nudivirus]|nr:hypothetical protein MrNuV_ORF028 [Macrobrachium rosenbergii nudivirus]
MKINSSNTVKKMYTLYFFLCVVLVMGVHATDKENNVITNYIFNQTYPKKNFTLEITECVNQLNVANVHYLYVKDKVVCDDMKVSITNITNLESMVITANTIKLENVIVDKELQVNNVKYFNSTNVIYREPLILNMAYDHEKNNTFIFNTPAKMTVIFSNKNIKTGFVSVLVDKLQVKNIYITVICIFFGLSILVFLVVLILVGRINRMRHSMGLLAFEIKTLYEDRDMTIRNSSNYKLVSSILKNDVRPYYNFDLTEVEVLEQTSV